MVMVFIRLYCRDNSFTRSAKYGDFGGYCRLLTSISGVFLEIPLSPFAPNLATDSRELNVVFLRILLHERSRHHNVERVGRRQNRIERRDDAVEISGTLAAATRCRDCEWGTPVG